MPKLLIMKRRSKQPPRQLLGMHIKNGMVRRCGIPKAANGRQPALPATEVSQERRNRPNLVLADVAYDTSDLMQLVARAIPGVGSGRKQAPELRRRP